MVRLPLSEREIPVIADAYVDLTFGTGCVKVTPAHDFNDYAVGQRHKLPLIPILTLDAKDQRQRAASLPGHGSLRSAPRSSPTSKQEGLLDKVDAHTLKVPRGDRTGEVIEPMLTDQWFVAMTRPVPTAAASPARRWPASHRAKSGSSPRTGSIPTTSG
jgi:valyl-tRNA synthetase